jgi:hypothetical protein
MLLPEARVKSRLDDLWVCVECSFQVLVWNPVPETRLELAIGHEPFSALRSVRPGKGIRQSVSKVMISTLLQQKVMRRSRCVRHRDVRRDAK